MADRELMLQQIERLAEELRIAGMAQTVNRSAYVLLVRHLAAQQVIEPQRLVADLRMIGGTEPDQGWQSGHEELAGVLEIACVQRAAPPK